MRVCTNPGHSTDTPTARAARGEIVVQRLAQTDDRELRRAVDAQPGDAAETGERRGVDDVALVLLEQERQEGVHAVHHPHQVHADRPLPERERGIDDAAAADAGVVAHHVDRAERRQRPVADRVDVGGDRHVGRHAHHVGALGLELRHRGRQRSRLDVGQHQAHAVGREALGQRPADAAGPAGDHGHPVLQLPHRAPFLSPGLPRPLLRTSVPQPGSEYLTLVRHLTTEREPR